MRVSFSPAARRIVALGLFFAPLAGSAHADPLDRVRAFCDDYGRCYETGDPPPRRDQRDYDRDDQGGGPVIPGYGGYERDDDRGPPPEYREPPPDYDRR